jgi:Fe-S-cluster containining protein
VLIYQNLLHPRKFVSATIAFYGKQTEGGGMRSHLIEFQNTGSKKIRISHDQAIDSIIKELEFTSFPNEAIAVLEFISDLKITRLSHYNFKAKDNTDEFEFSHHQFRNLLVNLFSLKTLLPQQLCDIYTSVFWVDTAPVKDSKSFLQEIEVDTEMDKFKCVHCGNCCTNLSDAHCTDCHPEDYIRWEGEERNDILAWISFGDLWISPKTGEDVDRCPWFRKKRNKNTYYCRIHETKPRHCREYPKFKRHALLTSCQGFDEPQQAHDYYFSKYRRI